VLTLRHPHVTCQHGRMIGGGGCGGGEGGGEEGDEEYTFARTQLLLSFLHLLCLLSTRARCSTALRQFADRGALFTLSSTAFSCSGRGIPHKETPCL
jgi:hypothetical protein